MAFWRPLTMDTWNPCSALFWTYANLFSKSDLEAVNEAKTNYLEALYTEIAQNPESITTSRMYCARSNTLIKQAVITPTGHVFEREEIKAYLKAHTFLVLPSNFKRQLYARDFYSFSKLSDEIKIITEQKTRFARAKALYIARAVNALRARSIRLLSSPPEIFICPLSKKLIRNPVLTPEGQLFERSAIELYYKKNDQCSRSAQLIEFKEFKEHLNECHTLLTKLSQTVEDVSQGIGPVTTKTTNTIGSYAHWLLFSWMSPAKTKLSPKETLEDDTNSPPKQKRKASWLCGL